MNYLQNFKPEVLALDGYHLKAYDCPVKLNQNESPFDVPETLKD
ncbi:MAG: histidinol-phosphate aminotransferase, partial [Candidatus Latescibacteria bacterium]|nr:histidinol-phosphate aminotransferase [Candidatus Latescibacterota bacterium]